MLILNISRLGYRFSNIIFLRTISASAKCTQQASNKILNSTKLYSTNIPLHEINTNVVKDVILFKYENPRFFRLMNIFALVQYGFWAYLAAFAYTSMRDAPVDPSKIDESSAWIYKINLGENKYKNSLAGFSLLIGVGSLCAAWTYTLRSVRYLVLHKGGQQVSFVTYTPFGKNRIMKVPVENVSCKASRSSARVQLPLKIKNVRWHYLLDMKGEFKNAPLFDATAGLFRKT